MKDDSRHHIYDELNKPPRTTIYEVEVFINTTDGIEPFDAFKTRSPPELPDEGGTYAASWVEDENGDEVHYAIPEDEIGTEGDYTSVTSTNLEITDKYTTYKKRTLTNDSDVDTETRLLITHHSLVLSTQP